MRAHQGVTETHTMATRESSLARYNRFSIAMNWFAASEGGRAGVGRSACAAAARKGGDAP